MNLLKNQWVKLIILLVLSGGVFVGAYAYDYEERSSSRSAMRRSASHDCGVTSYDTLETVRSNECARSALDRLHRREQRDHIASLRFGAIGVAAFWVLTGIVYWLLRRRRRGEATVDP